MDSKIKEVVAFVTGGASGIGKCVAEMIISNGGKVIIADICDQGKELAELMGPNAAFIHTDIVSEVSVGEALKFSALTFGNVNVVVNCAGILSSGAIYDFQADKPHPLEEVKKVFEVNTFGTFNVMTRSIGVMKGNTPDKDGQRGVIINIGSIAGFGFGHHNIAYGASKAAVIAMTETAARHVASVGIRVVTVAPGLIETPMTQHFKLDRLTAYIKQTMFPRRTGRPMEIAHLIKCIIENHLINAEIIRIDAGVRPINV